MKIVCAWCGDAIAVLCNHCGKELRAKGRNGETYANHDSPSQRALVCVAPTTPVIYSGYAIEEMSRKEGICETCANLDQEERDEKTRFYQDKKRNEAINRDNCERNARRQKGPQMLQIQEPPGETAPRDATQSPREKRGPKGVTGEPTHARDEEPDKDDGAT